MGTDRIEHVQKHSKKGAHETADSVTCVGMPCGLTTTAMWSSSYATASRVVCADASSCPGTGRHTTRCWMTSRSPGCTVLQQAVAIG